MAHGGFELDYALEVAPAQDRQWQWTVMHQGAPAARGDAVDEGAARRQGLVFTAALSALQRGARRRP